MACEEVSFRELRERGFRLTPQREMMLSVMHEFEGLATVDEIYRRVRARSAAVDISTVYRTLDLLQELQMVACVDPGDGQHRYELLAVGVAVAFSAFGMGVRSFAFTVFAVLGFPVWAYAGWFLMGCPAEDGKEKGYDISEPGEEGGRI